MSAASPAVPVITSAGNPAVKAARKLTTRAGRDGQHLLVEGPQAVREAGEHLRRLFVTPSAAREQDVVDAARARGAEVLTVSENVLSSLAGTVNPQGLVGVAVLPSAALDVLASAMLAVVLWQVRDPGNAGTAIRSADAAGADAVVLAGDSVDVTNPKVVRASAGSLFHLPVVRDVHFDAVAAACRRGGLRLVAAAGDGEAVYSELDLSAPTAMVFGNEARGLDPTVREACDVVARVPLFSGERPGYRGNAESLNLAATVAILLSEAARQRRERDVGARDA